MVNVQDLDAFDAGAEVNLDAVLQAGLSRKTGDLLKVLGNGELTKALTVKAHKFSASAQSKIEAAGGTAEVLD